jgi:hypothetical protein
MLAGVRNRGGRPCPRCLVTLSDTAKMGMALDLRQRQDNTRVDDHTLRYTISQARSAVYNSGYVVNSKFVDAMLKEHSLVPATVSVVAMTKFILIRSLECLFH